MSKPLTAKLPTPLQRVLRTLLVNALDDGQLKESMVALCEALRALPPPPTPRRSQPVPFIYRDGHEILKLRSKHAAALLAASNAGQEEQPFAYLYASTPVTDAPLEERLMGAKVPRVDLARSPGGVGCGLSLATAASLPDEAERLLGSRMAFVVTGHALWPSAEERWGDRAFLEAELAGISSCAVLAAPSTSKTFLYWLPHRRFASLAEAVAKGHDRVLAPYDFDEPSVEQLNLHVRDFFTLSDDSLGRDERASGRSFYLQHTIITPRQSNALEGGTASGSQMRATAGLGKRMTDDIERGINRTLLDAFSRAGALGPWISTVLFVGCGRSAAGARTRLHFDQVDNLYLQVAGVKRFRVFDPSQGASLASYPFHHPLDRSAQVDLSRPTESVRNFPRLSEARGSVVTLGPGDALFLPAYWWHEVLTDASDHPQGLTLSVNFWFSAHTQLADPSPSLPLRPMLEAELARQLEMAIADALDDRGEFVPPFLRAMRRQLEALIACVASMPDVSTQQMRQQRLSPSTSISWAVLQKQRPSGVAASAWAALFEYVVAKLLLWLPSPAHLLPFLRRHCCESRFKKLKLR